MAKVVDRWVQRLKDKLEPIGELTHWERLAGAFDRQRTDLVPVAPELDYWQITYAGYSHQEIYNDADKTTDACLKTWADLRTDAIWMYVDIGHQLEAFIPPERRAEHFIHRGEKDYLLFKPVATTLDEAWSYFVVRLIGRRQDCSQRNPNSSDGGHQVQFPAIDPAMPARFGPVRVGVNRRMGDNPLLSMFLVPDAAFGPKHRAINGRCAPAVSPRTYQADQVTSQTTNLPRQALGNGFQATLPRATGRVAIVYGQQRTQSAHLGRRLVQYAQQFVNLMQAANDHDNYRFQKQPVWIDLRSAWPPFRWGWRHRNSINKLHQRDKERFLRYHTGCLRIGMVSQPI